jgi:signal transduction histidine kinase
MNDSHRAIAIRIYDQFRPQFDDAEDAAMFIDEVAHAIAAAEAAVLEAAGVERLRLDFANACDVGRRLETRVNELLDELRLERESVANWQRLKLDADARADEAENKLRGAMHHIRELTERIDSDPASGVAATEDGCSSRVAPSGGDSAHPDNGLLGSQVIRDLVTVVLELHYDKATPGAADAAERLKDRYR